MANKSTNQRTAKWLKDRRLIKRDFTQLKIQLTSLIASERRWAARDLSFHSKASPALIHALTNESNDDVIDAILASLQQLRNKHPSVTTLELTSAPKWVSQLHHIARITLYKGLAASDKHLHIITYTPDEKELGNGIDPMTIVQQCPGLISFHIDTSEPISEEDTFSNSLNCKLDIQILVSSEPPQINEYFNRLNIPVHTYILDRQFLAFPEGKFIPTQAYRLFTDEINFSIINGDWKKYAQQSAAMFAVQANAPFQETTIEWLTALSHENKPNTRIIKALLAIFKAGNFDLVDSSQSAIALASSSFQPLSAALNSLFYDYSSETPNEMVNLSGHIVPIAQLRRLLGLNNSD